MPEDVCGVHYLLRTNYVVSTVDKKKNRESKQKGDTHKGEKKNTSAEILYVNLNIAKRKTLNDKLL